MNSIDIPTGKPISQLGNPEKPFENNSLQSIGKEKITSLKNSVNEIEYLIGQRESLSKSLSDEVEKIKMGIDNFLLKNVAVDSEDFKERSGLRQICLKHRPGMYLRNSRFGDRHNFANLFKSQFFIVIEGNYQLFLLG